jgi:hypothetical protein
MPQLRKAELIEGVVYVSVARSFRNVPLILGQVNFFMEFDICFYRSQLQFEISPKSVVLE